MTTWSRLKSRFLEGTDDDARAFWLGYALLLPYFLAPVFVTRYLPGLDLPYHLSMTDMLKKDGRPDSPYGTFYDGALSLAPYAAHYLALQALSVFVKLMTAHKLVVAAYVAGFPLATSMLLGACGRSRVPALLAFPLAYNLTLHYGFVSFALSLPVLVLLLGALARHLFEAGRPAGGPRRSRWGGAWTATAGAALLLFLCHLQSYLFGLCAAGAFLLFAGVKWRRRLLGALALAPSVAALLYWHLTATFEGDPTGQKKSLLFAWQTLKGERLADLGPRTFWEDIVDRIGLLPVHTLRGFADHVDVPYVRALFVVLAAYALLGIVALAAPAAPGPPARMRVGGWIVALGAATAYFGLPHHLPAFELMTFFPRFSVLLVLMALLVLPGSLRRYGPVGAYLLAVPAVAFGGLYGRELVRHYRYYDREVADFAAVVKPLAPGGKVLGLVFDRQSRVMRVESALLGLPNLYPALKPAPGSMVSLAYCGMRHMPCRRTPQVATLPDPGGWVPHLLDPVRAVAFFDYFLIRSPPPGRPIFGAASDKVELVARAGTWLSYRRKGAATAAALPGVD